MGETHLVLVDGGHVFLRGAEVHTLSQQRQREGTLVQAQQGAHVLINQLWDLKINK